MRKVFLVAIILVSACCGFAQQVETSRFEVGRWSKNQGCQFVSFAEKGGMMAFETDKTDADKNRLWNFVTLDTSLYEQRSDLIPLPDKLKLFDAKSSSQWAAFVFLDEKNSRSDSVAFFVVAYRHENQEFNTFTGKLPERSLLHGVALLDGTLMLSANVKTGGGFLVQYDLNRNSHRTITPNIGNDYVLFQFTALPEEHVFVLAAREYMEKRYKATTFQVYSLDGYLLQSKRYENPENAALGRMCFAFDDQRQLMVYATLEREGSKKVSVEGMTEDFSKTSVGVVWIKFTSSGLLDKTYVFKNMPEIDEALTAVERLRSKGDIAFQLYAPRLVKYGNLQVLATEAFQPVFHTETRMEYSYYGAYPMYYTIFDGYDFYSEILLAFDQDGGLQWFKALRFENELTEQLFAHASEIVCHDELLVVSPSRNSLRYEVFDADGSRLLDQHRAPLDFLYGTDTFEDEYEAGISQWYADRFIVHGCQILQNPRLRNTQRTVFYVQKVQYE